MLLLFKFIFLYILNFFHHDAYLFLFLPFVPHLAFCFDLVFCFSFVINWLISFLVSFACWVTLFYFVFFVCVCVCLYIFFWFCFYLSDSGFTICLGFIFCFSVPISWVLGRLLFILTPFSGLWDLWSLARSQAWTSRTGVPYPGH